MIVCEDREKEEQCAIAFSFQDTRLRQRSTRTLPKSKQKVVLRRGEILVPRDEKVGHVEKSTIVCFAVCQCVMILGTAAARQAPHVKAHAIHQMVNTGGE